MESKDYKDTLHLPQTEFPMRAGLPQREPEQVDRWLKDRVFEQMLEKNKSKPRFLLHDGPPYANGNIHIGHALNKVLKDVVIKYKNLSGFNAPYVPGWDCHGLPIELGVEKQLREQKRDKASVAVTELRALCREYAQKHIDIQKSQFQRLEIFGDWDHPYATMQPEYVASIIRELGKCSGRGSLYKGNKPVYWCPSCATALAEAEIEYADKKSPSIYVKFELTSEALSHYADLKKAADSVGASRACVIIWTTTPWTLPANLGVAMHPEMEYVAIEAPALEGTELWIMAKALQPAVEAAAGFEKPSKPVLTFGAEHLHRQWLKHPFIPGKKSLVVLGEHVTADAGTGAVHTAPGHGVDDYKVGSRYGLEIYAPVDERGRYTAAFAQGEFASFLGKPVFEANEPVIALLQERSNLLARNDIQHSYPHCWRCNKAVIFRATPQWFIGMEKTTPSGATLRQQAIDAIGQVKWVPDWGINRILGMVQGRPDWCISRQRVWGVPITVFYCTACNEPLATPQVFNHVADLVHESGPDVWYTKPAAELLPAGAKCGACGKKEFKKETDILDVWFDSGVSHAAVCEARELGWPADLYLEGSDQHRGCFQTSLITAIATRGRAPFKAVLTHGFVNDKDGKKMSKSKGNVSSPLDLMKTHGAEILRFWVCLEDYRNDVSFSMESLDRVSESYRKIRNTVRFILGNLSDFNPDKDALPVSELGKLDRWALSRSAEALSHITDSFESYEFHRVYHELVNYCGVELSAIYFDILKDRLYTAGKASRERRSSQTALFLIGRALTTCLAPILSFTAEELWGFLPQWKGKPASVFLSDWPRAALTEWKNAEIEKSFEPIWKLREPVLRELEVARQAKTIGHPREARVSLAADAEAVNALRGVGEDPKRLFLVSELELTQGATLSVRVERAPGEKCARCWTFDREVGKSAQHPDLCVRCEQAL